MTTPSVVAVRRPGLPGHGLGARAARRFVRDPAGLAGAVIVGALLLVAVAVWTGLLAADWSRVVAAPWTEPGAEHWWGTNRLGQDIFARAMAATAIAFEVGLPVAIVSTLLGAVLGGLAGWFAHRWTDEALLWLAGVLDSIPFYLFVAAVAYALGDRPGAMQLAMIVTFWTTTARLVRAEVMRLKGRAFVDAARLVGYGEWRVLTRHVLPNTLHILLVQSAIAFIAAIKAEVVLSFLGIGIRDGVSWGLMLAESTQEVLAGQFGNFLAASTLLFLLLLGLNLVTDALQDATDPRGGRTP